jgi:hypothetical protein
MDNRKNTFTIKGIEYLTGIKAQAISVLQKKVFDSVIHPYHCKF